MRDRYAEVGSEPTFYSGLDELTEKTPQEKLQWFRGRFNKIIVTPLEEVRVLGVENQKIWDLNLGVVTLICTAIEALGSFYSPRAETDKLKFVSFVERFMDPAYRSTSCDGSQKYSEILYTRFRCGLAHGMSIEGHEVASRPSQYLADDAGYVSIDLWGLFDDFKRAFEAYVDTVSTDSAVQDAFLARFNDVLEKPYENRKA